MKKFILYDNKLRTRINHLIKDVENCNLYRI